MPQLATNKNILGITSSYTLFWCRELKFIPSPMMIIEFLVGPSPRSPSSSQELSSSSFAPWDVGHGGSDFFRIFPTRSLLLGFSTYQTCGYEILSTWSILPYPKWGDKEKARSRVRELPKILGSRKVSTPTRGLCWFCRGRNQVICLQPL